MKEISIAIASMGLILSLHADAASDSGLIAAKEMWGSGYGDEAVSPSDVDDDYDEDQNSQKNEPWPKRKPGVEEGTSIFQPKASKDIFKSGEGEGD